MNDKELIESLVQYSEGFDVENGEIDAFRAAADRLRELTELRPMETAPRDGTEFLIFDPHHGWSWACYERHVDPEWAGGNTWFSWSLKRGAFQNTCPIDEQCYAIGWLPLPALPPTEDEN